MMIVRTVVKTRISHGQGTAAAKNGLGSSADTVNFFIFSLCASSRFPEVNSGHCVWSARRSFSPNSIITFPAALAATCNVAVQHYQTLQFTVTGVQRSAFIKSCDQCKKMHFF